MTATILTVANQKGGAGKTTVAVHLAGLLGGAGRKTLLVDSDAQATAYRWCTAGSDFPAAVVQMSGDGGAKLHEQLRRFVGDYEWIIVDTPPAVDSPAAQSALLVSDLAIVPVPPSPPDLWATVHIIQAIRTARVYNVGLRGFILLNQLKAGTLLGIEIHKALAGLDLPVLDSALGDREVYRQAAAYGQIALNQGNAAANVELRGLLDELQRIAQEAT